LLNFKHKYSKIWNFSAKPFVPPELEQPSSLPVYLGVSLSAVAVFIVALVIGLFRYKQVQFKKRLQLQSKEIENFMKGNPDLAVNKTDGNMLATNLPFDDSYEINPLDINLRKTKI